MKGHFAGLNSYSSVWKSFVRVLLLQLLCYRSGVSSRVVQPAGAPPFSHFLSGGLAGPVQILEYMGARHTKRNTTKEGEKIEHLKG